MSITVLHLLEYERQLRQMGWTVAAHKVEQAIVQALFEDLMERESMDDLIYDN